MDPLSFEMSCHASKPIGQWKTAKPMISNWVNKSTTDDWIPHKNGKDKESCLGLGGSDHFFMTISLTHVQGQQKNIASKLNQIPISFRKQDN